MTPGAGRDAAKAAFYADVSEFVGWYLAQNPVAATDLGAHNWDDRLADLSAGGLRTLRTGLEVFRDRVARYTADGADPAGDDVDWAIDLRLMAAFARSGLRGLVDADLPHRSPDFYAAEALFGPYSLLLKDFAPLDERMRHLAGRLADVPRVLADAEANLDVCPHLWVETALETTGGGLSLFQQLVPALAAGVRDGDPLLAARVEATNAKAIAAVERFRQFLAETLLPRVGGTFAVGETAWDGIVREEHMLDLDA
ncbi:MAG TPA: DUF885 family protein, partial [Chloroflexia bacterium]|nr:DUF885 family protein [Chloroflexia bacterium]